MTVTREPEFEVVATESSTVPVSVVSADSHVGPRIKEDLRPYCPTGYLDEFDAFVAKYQPPEGGTHVHIDVDEYPFPEADQRRNRARENAAVRGHYDMNARLADMDRDGVAAEVHLPRQPKRAAVPLCPRPAGCVPVAGRWGCPPVGIGRRRAADLQPLARRRLCGCARPSGRPGPPAAVGYRCLHQGHGGGLPVWGCGRSNFPATPRPGMLDVDFPDWEPFWSACEDLGVPIVTHCGVADPEQWDGPTKGVIKFLEGGTWLSRRALPRFIFSGVFERHPNLRLVYTELMQQGATWWPGAAASSIRCGTVGAGYAATSAPVLRVSTWPPTCSTPTACCTAPRRRPIPPLAWVTPAT